jgi:predicted ATPase
MGVKHVKPFAADRHPVLRASHFVQSTLDLSTWPATIPAVDQLLREGMTFPKATIFVGDNGSGKSTVLEAIAMAFGINPEGGSTSARHQTRVTESPLSEALTLQRGIGSTRWGYFLRAETMHAFYTYLEDLGTGSAYHEMSHGESFAQLLEDKFQGPGLFLLDEPESALSFTGCLALLRALHDLVADGRSQVILATHSPVVASLPGAQIFEFDNEGFHERPWEELQLVNYYRHFLAAPEQYLRHVFAPTDTELEPDGRPDR